MHVASVSLFELPARYRRDFHAELKRGLARRLHLAPVLHRRLAPMPLQFANPVWIDDDAVDLDHHVQRVTLPPPGSMSQFDDCIGRLHAELLDRGRPLWRLHVIDGLASGQVGHYFKAHHAALDGQAGIALARTLFDLAPRPPPVPRARGAAAAEPPGPIDLAAAALRHDAGQCVKLVRHLPEVVRTLAGLLGPAKARGALRRYLAHHGGVPKKPLTAAMPISLREAGNAEYTTQATLPLVNLQTHIADPLRRLAAIRDAAGAVKAMVRQASGVVPMDFPSAGMPWLLQGLAAVFGRAQAAGVVPVLADVVISNIPGPEVPLYAAGARMAAYWPVSIVEHGLGLNITVISYAGAMGFGFTTARAAVPDAHRLTRALAEAFDELLVTTCRPPAAGGCARTPRHCGDPDKTVKPQEAGTMNTAHAAPRATLVGGGIAGLAAAVRLVRDGQLPGSRRAPAAWSIRTR